MEIQREDVKNLLYSRRLLLNLHPKPKTVSELKVALEKILHNFPQVQVTKLSRVLEIV